MKPQKHNIPIATGHPERPPKRIANGSQNDVQKSPRNDISGEASNAQNTLVSLCFRTKRSLAGPPKGLPKGTPKGSQKGARNEARKGAEAGIDSKEIIVVKL